MLTNAVDEDARQDEVEDVEHWPPPDPDVVGDVNEGPRAAGVVDLVPLGLEGLQLELAIGLVVAGVASVVDDVHVQLPKEKRHQNPLFCASRRKRVIGLAFGTGKEPISAGLILEALFWEGILLQTMGASPQSPQTMTAIVH